MINYKADFVYFKECIKLINIGSSAATGSNCGKFVISKQICKRVIAYINALVNIEKLCESYHTGKITRDKFTVEVCRIIDILNGKTSA